MSNPTSNFLWQMPTATDLVTDLPADFEVFGQAVDTSLADLKGGTTGQVLKKNTNADMDFVWSAEAGMTNPMTTTGDTIYSSSGSTPARLGIGSTGQVLTVAGGVPTWAAASAGATNFVTLNSTGTTLTGAQTITISGLSGYNKLMIYVQGASDNVGGSSFAVQFNSDGTAKYGNYGSRFDWETSYSVGQFGVNSTTNTTGLIFGKMNDSAASTVSGYLLIDGANSSGRKVINYLAQGSFNSGSVGQRTHIMGAYYDGTSAISSFTIVSDQGNFDAGTVRIFGAN